jgi:ComF family protein
MITAAQLKDAFLHLLFPNVCVGCGNDLPGTVSALCFKCIAALPETGFETFDANPVEKKFWGRLPIYFATAQYYFTSESLVQHLMHQFKYRGNKSLGLQLGRMMADNIVNSNRPVPDGLIPLPLFASKEKRRGFNQATVLCEGMAEVLNIPVLNNVVIRSMDTDTQTRKGRIERWQNMEGKFVLSNPLLAAGRHLMLVDDVVTTGATLEACGIELLKAQNVTLSIATLCYASR